MLTRAARRRYNLRYFQHAADQIQLPWLCPALVDASTRLCQRRQITSRSSVSRTKPTSIPSTQLRQLASATTIPETFDRNDDFLPFPRPHQEIQSLQQLEFDVPLINQWDPSNILKIDYTTALPPGRLVTKQVLGLDSRGNADEIEVTMQACLQVNQWDRAFALLGQLKLLYDKQKLLNAYNSVLYAMVDDLLVNQNRQNEDKINKWVEVDMSAADLEPNAVTFALKIKAALGSLLGSKRDRTVRRYWEMAKKYELENEAVSYRDILSERDLGKLSQICPLKSTGVEYNHEISVENLEDLREFQSYQSDITIRETEQKGQGLAALKQSLALFSNKPEDDLNLQETVENLKSYDENKVARQMRLEKDAIDSAINRWKADHEKMAKMGISTNLANGKLGALLWQWHEILTKRIVKELDLVRQSVAKTKKTEEDRRRSEYGPFLASLNPEKMAAVATISMIQLLSRVGVANGMKLVKAVSNIGKAIEVERDAEILRAKSAYPRRNREPDRTRLQRYFKTAKHSLANESGEDKTRNSHLYTKLEWTPSIHTKLGAILCELLFDTARMSITKKDELSGKTMTIAQPIFVRQPVFQNGKRVTVVSAHESFRELITAVPPGNLIAKQLPMLCEPRPWKGFLDGGYLNADQPFLRIKFSESAQRDYTIAAADRGDLDQIFAGADILGRTGWKINKAVFDVMAEAWNSGEAIANLAPILTPTEAEKLSPDATPSERAKYYNKMRVMENQRSGVHSNRCFQNFQMEIAKAFLNETFYLPHNIDFRGRAYPIPPYLNQMGADNCRGILLFAKGRELGKDGLQWLKIHLSNVYGYDKASLSDRAKFPMDHLEEIYDSVRNPLGGKKWWLTAEDPWQCLATCFELTSALDASDPTKFVSHLPIHQDGSCNGLQHYAALGGDIAGAKQVNLEPGDKPADVYTGVCELVREEISRDAAEGHELAKLLDGRITRKVVKQTVMTNVYGVTFLGAIRQIRKQLEFLMPELEIEQKAGQSAAYVARKVFRALGAMFTGAHDIQYWLGDCANRISTSLSPAQMDLIAKQAEAVQASADAKPRQKKVSIRPSGKRQDMRNSKKQDMLDPSSFRSSVIWTTPLKLPVVQPYRVHKGAKVSTNMQSITLVEPSVADGVNKRKQLQAFPPNFIHSLDATHMILSALMSAERGLTFASVHDSFWTHAADVGELNILLRDAFIRMHSEDIIGRLAAEFKARYQGHIYLAKLNKSNQLAKAIAKYRKEMVSKGEFTRVDGGAGTAVRRHQELLREMKKQKLMNSDNPAEREEGKQMVTASSLYQEYNGDKYLFSRDSLGETAIGNIPDVSDQSIEAEVKDDSVSTTDMAEASQTLEGSVTTPDDVDELGDDDTIISSLNETAGEQESKQSQAKKVTKTKHSVNNQIWLWLPLTFREVPKKGEFDVNRLRESQYFFS